MKQTHLKKKNSKVYLLWMKEPRSQTSLLPSCHYERERGEYLNLNCRLIVQHVRFRKPLLFYFFILFSVLVFCMRELHRAVVVVTVRRQICAACSRSPSSNSVCGYRCQWVVRVFVCVSVVWGRSFHQLCRYHSGWNSFISPPPNSLFSSFSLFLDSFATLFSRLLTLSLCCLSFTL